MSNYYTIRKETLTGIADAIREKSGSSNGYTPVEMAVAIRGLETGGGAAFNIAYGDTAPEDTSALWVKAAAAEGVRLSSRPVVAGAELERGIHSLPVATSHMGAASVGTKIYLFGGNAQGYATDAIYIFDTETNTISTADARLPWGMTSVAAAAVGRKVYLFGGYYSAISAHRGEIFVFDTESNTVSEVVTRLPKEASRVAAAAVGEKVFLFGGQAADGRGDWIWVFDAATHSVYTLGTRLPAALHDIHVVTIGRKIYLLGGVSDNGRVDAIYVFDAENYTLSRKNGTIPSAIGASYGAVGAVGTKVYLFGGRTMGNVTTDTVGVYHVETDSMEVIAEKLPVGAESGVAATVGGSIYLFGGANTAYLPAIHRFATSLPLTRNQLLIEISQTENFVALSGAVNGGVEIGVANVYRGNADGVAEKVAAAVYKEGVWKEI